MKGTARVGDTCSGHDSFSSRPCITGSSDVIINGKGVHRQGDSWASHDDGDSSHDGILIGGSSSVFTNGKSTGRCGDLISCGSTIATCSSNVLCGD